MMVKSPVRPGFTLLEVLLASAIAILLLGALYVAFDVTLRQADSSRETVARGDITRAVANRLTIDVSCCIGPMPPKSGGGLPPETSTPSANSSLDSAAVATGVATGTVDLEQSEGTTGADVFFQGGLFGTDKQVTLFVSRVPPSLANPESADPLLAGSYDSRPDLRRITYYIGARGLCRQEKPWVTADGVRNSTDPDRNDEDSDLLFEEVTDITLSYFGPNGWQDSWTGSDQASDGASILGPPRAIKITMTIQSAGSQPRTVSHVIAVRAAVGLQQPPAAETTTDPSTSTTPTTTP